MVHANGGASPEHIAKGRDFFERALALGSRQYRGAGRRVATCRVAQCFLLYERPASASSRGIRGCVGLRSCRSRQIMPRPIVYWVSPKYFSNRALQGIAECERALALDRNLAVAHAQIGFAARCNRPRRRYRSPCPRGAPSFSTGYQRKRVDGVGGERQVAAWSR